MPDSPLTPRKKTAVIVIIGNEILEGYTQDTNSHFLFQTLREAGVECLACHTIRDDKEEIKRYLRLGLEEGANYLFFSGGLGPTHDDVTFEAVAEALQKRLVLSEKAITNIQDRLDLINAILPAESKIEMNEASRKMAMVPEGTQVLCNKAGTAPAVAVNVGACWLFLLPGVPHELEWLLQHQILGSFIPAQPKDYRLEIPVHKGESNFAQILKDIQESHPGVKIGSYPGPGRVTLRVSGKKEEVEAVEALVRERIVKGLPDWKGWRKNHD